MNIYEKMIEVKNAVHCVEKDLDIKNKNGRVMYSATGHDAVTRAIRDELNKAGIYPLPTCTSYKERIEKGLTTALVTMQVKFINAQDPEGHSIVCEMPGEGQDYGDKAYGKAISIATKYCYLKALQLASGVNEEERVEQPKQNENLPKPANRVREEYNPKDSSKFDFNDDPSPVSATTAAEWRTRLEAIGKQEHKFLIFINEQMRKAYKTLNQVSVGNSGAVDKFISMAERKTEKIREEKKGVRDKGINDVYDALTYPKFLYENPD